MTQMAQMRGVSVWAFRLEDSPSGFPLQVLAVASSFLLAIGSGLSGPIPNAECSPAIVHRLS